MAQRGRRRATTAGLRVMIGKLVRRLSPLPLVGGLALVGCGRAEPPRPAPEDVVTTVLAAPPEVAAFAPTLAIDPANPDQIIVAASRGVAPIRNSVGIWTWRSDDGGRTWSDGALDTPHFPGDSAEQIFGAHAVADFAADGAALVTSIAGFGRRMGSFVSRRAVGDSTGSAVAAFENFNDSQNGRGIVFGKPWMAVDREEKSPFYGSVYVSAEAILLDGTRAAPGDPLASIPSTSVRLVASRDGGQTFAPLTLVADSAFAAQMVVTHEAGCSMLPTIGW